MILKMSMLKTGMTPTSFSVPDRDKYNKKVICIKQTFNYMQHSLT